MNFFSKKDCFRKRTLRFESLEHRELLSVSPLTYPTESSQGQYGSDFNTEAAPDMGGEAVKITGITSTTMTISWDAAKMTGLRTSDGFTVERLSLNSKGEEVWTKVGTVPYSYTTGNGIYSYELTGLTALTEYTHRVTYGSTTLGTGHTDRVTATTDKHEITAEPASSTSVTVSWNFAAKNNTKYEIWMNTDGSDNFTDTGKTVTATGSAKAFTCTVDKLNPATEYTFIIKYYDSNTVAQKTQKITCSTQHTLQIGETTPNSVELYWDRAIGGEDYQLQISSNSDSTWKNATSTPITGQPGDTFDYVTYIKHEISGLKDNETYSFRLRYKDSEGVTRYTDPMSYSTLATISVDTVTDTTAVVKWSFPNKSGTAYYVQTKTGSGDWSDYSGANTSNKTWTLTGLKAGTTYEIRIRYTDPKGDTATYYSSSETITTAVPTKLESVTESSVKISWDIPNQHSTQNTVSVQRCDGSLDPKVDSNWRTVASGLDTTNYESNYLGSDKEYFFRVVYTDVDGETQNTLHVSARTVGIVTATESSIDSVTLEWNFIPANTNYTVQYVQSANPVGFSDVPKDQISKPTLNGCTVTGLEKGKPYFFRVIYTPEGETTTKLTSTVTKTISTVNANIIVTDQTESTVTLHWAPNNFSGGAQNLDFIIYKYEKSDRPGEKTWKEILRIDAATAKQNNYECTLTGLMADIDYQFKIGYTGSTSTTAQSDTVSATTEAYEVTITELSKTTAELQWEFDTYEHSPTSSDQGGDSAGVFTIEEYIGTNFPPTEADRLNDALWDEIGTSTWKNHWYVLDKLVMNTTYYYRVSYTYQTGDSKKGSEDKYDFPQSKKYSQIVEVKTKSDLSVEYVDSNRVTIKWDKQTLTTGSSYTVQARVAGDTGWPSNMQFTVASSKTDYTFENLTAETEYEFQVTYTTSGGAGNTVILKETTTKFIPSVVFKEINGQYAKATVQIGYTGVESNFKLMYRLKTPQNDGNWTDAAVTATTGTKTVEMSVDTIRPELEYEFKIVYTAHGNTVESETTSATVSDDLSPENVGSTSAKITWLASSFPDKRTSSSYTVQWREADPTNTTDWKGTTETTSTSSTSYTVTGLEPNKDYEFRIMYFTVGDAQAFSTIKTVRTGQPTITATAPQVGSVKLAWTFESASDGFIIQYKDENNVWQTAATVSKNDDTQTTVSLLQNTGANLDPEKEYTFRIAYKTSQSGSSYVYSDEIEVTTLGGLQIVENSATTTTIKIKWDYVTDATYQIHYREKGSSADYEKILGIEKTAREHELKDLKPGVEYEIKLVYSDSFDKDETIYSKTTVDVPAKPTGITAGDITSDSVTLKWIDNSSFEEDYILEVINSVTGVVFFKDSIGKRLGSSASNTDYATHELTGLDTNTKYTVKLYATNAEGSSAVETGTFTTLDVARPNKVDKIAAAATPKSVTLSWKIKSLDGVPDPTVATDFRIEYKYTDENKVSNWYVVTNVTITPNTETETWYAVITDKIEFGDGKSVEFENKTNYTFRVTVLGDNLGGSSSTTKYGDSLDVEKTAKTTSITVPSSLGSSNITLTTATIKFKDTDKTLDASEKTYTIWIVEGKYTDWTKVPTDAVLTEFTVDKTTLASSYYYHDLTGLKAGTTYSYVVEWDWAGETIQSKAGNFTTKALPKASTLKTGYTLTSTGELASQISWKPPASTNSVPIPTDTVITYTIEVSLNGKAGTFVTLTDSLELSTSPKGLKYGAISFSKLAAALPGGVDITTCKSLYIRVATTFKQGSTVIGTSYSTNGKITLPKFS